MKNSAKILAVLMLVALAPFQNCAKTNFYSGAAGAVPQAATGTSDDVIGSIVTNCELARKKGKLKEMTATISFGNPLSEVAVAPVCKWEQNGNFAPLNGSIRARHEQVAAVPLPDGATLCDMDFTFASQQMQYDDIFLFTLNGAVLASDQKWALAALDSSNVSLQDASFSIPLYSWEKYGNQKHPANINSTADNFCFGLEQGLGACSWPLTEHTGQISMAFDPRMIVAVGQMAADKSQQTFSFITTGDNDNKSDCQHLPVTFTVKMNYY